ncbi:transmembrane protein 79 [Echeneis naucrates]|uniref:Transmembrane protein 79-like n=1 Tax=Echeneis naucrates TaxID=173247 RepID=A0A665T5J1_ECHNA|nr:transmembrane protein 79-like [Echeneis naucrates]
MSSPGGLISESTEGVTLSPDGQTAEPQVTGNKKAQEINSVEEGKVTDEEDKEEKDQEEEVTSSALLEPSTLPWPGDRDKKPHTDNSDGVCSEDTSESNKRDTDMSKESQDLSESLAESSRKSKAKWRESMPEGERWRDEEVEAERENGGDGSLADDEEEDAEDETSNWISEKAALGFTPHVTIVRPSSKELRGENRFFVEKDVDKEPPLEPHSVRHFYPEQTEQDDKLYLCENLCSGKLRLALAIAAAGLIFPFLVWGGYKFLPFEPPVLQSAPLRLVYTLRCSFFAIIPIMFGVVVQGVARLRYRALKPLYQADPVHREIAVHRHYVNESIALFIFYFLQLAVMGTYISQDLVKLVPLLSIIFAFGRLIYWLCLSLGSSIRGFGFGFSFFPILVMLGVNFYYICSSVGEDAVFAVEPPTTAPPPRQRWWG